MTSPRWPVIPRWRKSSPTPGPEWCSCTCRAFPQRCKTTRGTTTWSLKSTTSWLRESQWCASRGIPRERIAIDPGIGFGKTFEHNLQLLRNLDRFVNLGCVVLVGISRKGFLKPITGRSKSERMVGSVVSSLAACTLGAGVVRVHDVQAMADAIKVWTALRDWGAST